MRAWPVNADDVYHVALHMRERDQREIYATAWRDDPVDVTTDCLVCPEFSWIVGDHEPVAVVGAKPIHPGVWRVFMFATDRWSQVSLFLTKFIKRVMIPALRSIGAHRAECLSIEGYDAAHRWLEFLGARHEGTQSGYGKAGEDFRLYVWRG